MYSCLDPLQRLESFRGNGSQATEDQILCFFRSPGLDAALKRPKLRVAGVCIGYRRSQATHQLFSAGSWIGDEPTFDDWPGKFERVRAGSPPARFRYLAPMRRADLAGLPSRRQAFEILRQ
mgnify:CR=1 FL=1